MYEMGGYPTLIRKWCCVVLYIAQVLCLLLLTMTPTPILCCDAVERVVTSLVVLCTLGESTYVRLG